MHPITLPFSSANESDALDALLTPIDKNRFQGAIRRLHSMFSLYACTSSEPLPAPGLIVTPEIRVQCERYLPIATVAATFNRLYSAALTYSPVLSSTPFFNMLSWADAFAILPAQFQISSDPAQLLESLLADQPLLIRFLFTSFLPERFYGRTGRYPEQQIFIREWSASRRTATIRCLDTACGTGENTYGLALLLSEQGFLPENVRIEGWTLDPLEVWAATYRRIPYDRRREELLRESTGTLFHRGYGSRISFHCRDISAPSSAGNSPVQADFDLIVCNGLLGGPIIHEKEQMKRVVAYLCQLVAPGGVLLADNNFHGGWKQKCPQKDLRSLFEQSGLDFFEVGEGVGGIKPGPPVIQATQPVMTSFHCGCNG